MTLSKIISSEELTELQQWDLPEVGEDQGAGKRVRHGRSAPPTVEELDDIQRKAYEEGFDQGKQKGFEYGHKEGIEQSRREMQACVEKIDGFLSALDKPFRQLDDQVEQEIVTLVVSMVRQLVRREVNADPNQIVGVVREALSILPVASRNVQLILHPDDAELIREIYTLSETELGWKIVDDPVMSRGGCRVVTDTSQIDATLESRLTSLIAPLLGGARISDETEE